MVCALCLIPGIAGMINVLVCKIVGLIVDVISKIMCYNMVMCFNLHIGWCHKCNSKYNSKYEKYSVRYNSSYNK